MSIGLPTSPRTAALRKRTPSASDALTLAFLHDPQNSGPKPWVVMAASFTVMAASAGALFLPLKPEAIGVCALVLMMSLMFLRVPVSIAMTIPALLGMYSLRGMKLVTSTLTDLPYDQVAQWTLSVVPMFVFMGLLLWRAGLTQTLYDTAKHWLGWVPGGLAVGTNVAGSGLAAVSGSTIGTTYALARIGIPEMLRAGYDKRMALGAVMVAGLPGQLIPPSIMLVIYAGIAETPVGPQLLAGVGPGLLVAVMFTVMIIVICKFRPEIAGAGRGAALQRYPLRERLLTLAKVWPIPLIMLVVIWGMFSGTFTATEAGACAALMALVVTVIWKFRDKPWGAVSSAAMGTVSSVGAIFFMLIGVEALSRMLTLTGISSGFAGIIEGYGFNRVGFLLVMTAVYLIMGMFMEPLAMMLLTVPILIPTLLALDISLLWYGVFAVFMGEIAILTPPVGILAFIIHKIAQDPEVNLGQDISLKDVFVALSWFLPMTIVVTLILIYFPEIATLIPDLGAGE